MPLSYRTLAITTAFVCFALAAIWIFAPSLLLDLWNVDDAYPVRQIGRRGGAIFLGVGMIFLLTRDAAPSPIRAGIAKGIIVGALALASLGIFEFMTGHAGPGIWAAIAVELILGVAFLRFSRTAPQTS